MKVAEMKRSIISFNSTATGTGAGNSSSNSSLLESSSDSQEASPPGIQLNLMQLMKEQGSFPKFRKQAQQKRRLYESESNYNPDVYAANVAQHIIYSYQNNLHEDYLQEEAYQAVMVDKPSDDRNEQELENPFNENALNLQFSEPHFPLQATMMHKQMSLDCSNKFANFGGKLKMTGTDFQPAIHHQRAKSMTSNGDSVSSDICIESQGDRMGYETFSQEQSFSHFVSQ